MEIRFYALAEWLGLVTDLRGLPGDETWRVSASADEVFLWLGVGLSVLLFVLGALLGRLCASRTPVRAAVVLMAIYALLLAVGIGPYIRFYPTGGSFIDFSLIEHIFDGIICAGRAALLWAGSLLGRRLRGKKEASAC